MTVWIIIAALSAATVVTLVFGARMAGKSAAGSVGLGQLAVYKDQLAEIDADLARGLIGAVEAKSHHAEVARRLLAVAGEADARKAQEFGVLNRWPGLVAALLVPALALAIYARVGAPALPDRPQAERLAMAETTNDLEAMVYKVEKHLVQNPDDATGWEILIPSYQSMNRYADAAEAYRRLIAIKGPTADRYASLAEMLMLAGKGLLPKEGAQAARAAFAIDATHVKARFFEALALSQEGQIDMALTKFEALLADSPAGAPWRGAVEREIASLTAADATAPQLSQDQLDAAQAMTAEDQQQMIRAMVDGLAAKLDTNPKDLQGWFRLIRALVVLNDSDRAVRALGTARKVFVGDQAARAQIETLSQQLNLP